jgi:hypothetical protein
VLIRLCAAGVVMDGSYACVLLIFAAALCNSPPAAVPHDHDHDQPLTAHVSRYARKRKAGPTWQEDVTREMVKHMKEEHWKLLRASYHPPPIAKNGALPLFAPVSAPLSQLDVRQPLGHMVNEVRHRTHTQTNDLSSVQEWLLTNVTISDDVTDGVYMCVCDVQKALTDIRLVFKERIAAGEFRQKELDLKLANKFGYMRFLANETEDERKKRILKTASNTRKLQVPYSSSETTSRTLWKRAKVQRCVSHLFCVILLCALECTENTCPHSLGQPESRCLAHCPLSHSRSHVV